MSDEAKSGGIGLCGALFIVFVVLRLTDHIDWAWYWVASPLWLPITVALAGILAGVVFYYTVAVPIAALIDTVSARRRAREARK